MTRTVMVACAIVAVVMTSGVMVSSGQGREPVIIIAHRGASGHRPEHTLEAYRLAIEMGADYIEPDLVSTRDGVLIARHENEIGATTDVAERFPERKSTKEIDGRRVTGWFAEDFTSAEIRSLRARERLPFRSHEFDGQFAIPTFDEVIALARTMGAARGREVGIYPETKHPSYFRALGLPLEPALLASLERVGWNGAAAPVFIQSFETDNLRMLRAQTRLRLTQLIDAQSGPWDRREASTFRTPRDLTSAAGLREMSQYADGIGVHQHLVLPVGQDGGVLAPTDLVVRAHDAGLFVHVWTLRPEPMFLSPSYEGMPAREFLRFRDLGVDGIFTDVPDIGVRALTGDSSTGAGAR